MKTIFTCAFILPILAACAAPATDENTASNEQETVYTTGSNLPSKQNKANVKTLSQDQARDMVQPAALRGPKN